MKPQVSFSLNFASLFNVLRDRSSVLSSQNFIWFLQKEPTFGCSGEISPNLHFDRLLLLKLYKISVKKVHRSYVSWHCIVVENLNNNQCFVSKMTRVWWILIGALNKKFKKFALWLAPVVQVYNVWPKKYRGVTFHNTDESCKIWRKTELWFGKWHDEFGKFSSEHLKVSKLVLSWDPFVQIRKCIS